MSDDPHSDGGQGTTDPYNLQRFVDAQRASYERAVSELRRGSKQSHWMWYIFPQLRGLGQSSMSETFGITSEKEAIAYVSHPVLGPRLVECTRLVLNTDGRSLEEIFPFPDNLKFCSAMTLFAHVAEGEDIFREALGKYCGEPGLATLRLLQSD
jgi:uncharacterized protein (DUF1810 family)